MITIGVDFHKRTSSYRMLDDKGKPISRFKIENDPERIRSLISSFPGEKQLTIEATRSWSLYYECVKDLVDHFYLGHPKKMKAVTNSETKNDKTDADMIAKLTHSGFLPKAHVSSTTIREIRSLVRFRGHLVNQRRAIRNQVHSIIDRNVCTAINRLPLRISSVHVDENGSLSYNFPNVSVLSLSSASSNSTR